MLTDEKTYNRLILTILQQVSKNSEGKYDKNV